MENENAETAAPAKIRSKEEVSGEASKPELDRVIRHHVWASIGIALVPHSP